MKEPKKKATNSRQEMSLLKIENKVRGYTGIPYYKTNIVV